VLCLACLRGGYGSRVRANCAADRTHNLNFQEREAALKQFEATRDNFLKSIADFAEAMDIQIRPDRWSVAEVAEHIAVSESAIFSLVQKTVQSPAAPEKRDQFKGKDEMILQRVPDRSHKAQAPEFLRPTGRWATERS